MIDTVLNLIFRCPHRHLTRPITPVSKAGAPHGETYVVCLDCTKQYAYDLKNMRMGEEIHQSHEASVVPVKSARPRQTKLKYALGIAVPLAVLIGSAYAGKKGKKAAQPQDSNKPKAGSGDDLKRA